MREMKKLFLMIIIFVDIFTLKSQNKFDIEASGGFIYFDYFGNEPKGFVNEFAGYGLQSEYNFWYKFFNKGNFIIKSGIGYTQFNYINSYFYYNFANANDLNSSSFINLKLGAEYKPKWSKISFILNSSHYMPLGKKFFGQYNWFTNLDVGLKIKRNNHLSLSFWIPLTLRPILDGSLIEKPDELILLNFNPWTEMTGLNIGISYSFNK